MNFVTADVPVIKAVRIAAFYLFVLVSPANAAATDGAMPLHAAIRDGDIAEMQRLLTQGADADRADGDGVTPLHLAAESGNRAMVELLLQKGARKEAVDTHGAYPWHYALRQGNRKLAARLATERAAHPTEGGDGPFSDPRVARWAMLYLLGEADTVLDEVESSLGAANAPDLAPQVWTEIHQRRGTLAEAWRGLAVPVRTAIGITPEVALLKKQHRIGDVLERFPPDFDFAPHDLFGIVDLAYAAEEFDDVELKFRYLLKAAQVHPDVFQIVWMADGPNDVNRTSVRQLLEAYVEGHDSDTLFAEHLRRVLKFRGFQRADSLQGAQEWLKARPSDARAHTAAGNALSAHYHHEEALTAYFRGIELFPFFWNGYKPVSRLIRLGRHDQARRYALMIAQLTDSRDRNDPPESLGLRNYAYELRYSGDKGAARQIAQEGAERWPKAHKWKRLLGYLERDNKRHAPAVEHLAEAARQAPDSRKDRRLHVRSLLDADRIDEAWAAFGTLVEDTSWINPELMLLGTDILQARGDAELLLEFVRKAYDRFPESLELRGRLAKALWLAGERAEALPLLATAVEEAPSDDDLIALYGKYLLAAEGTEETTRRWNRLHEAYPWSKSLWVWNAKNLMDSSDERLALWGRAREAMPDALWAYDKRIDLWAGRRNWSAAFEELVAYDERVLGKELPATDRLYRDVVIAWLLAKSAEDGDPPINWPWDVLEHYRENYGSLATYYRYLARHRRLAGDQEEAAEAFLKLSQLRPDDTGIFHDLVATYSGELTRGQTFGYGWRMVQRDPFNALKGERFVHKHVLWGGSPVVALKQIETMRARGMSVPRNLERRARSRLGDTVSLFRGYLTHTRIPPSDRYIEWFHSARQDALEGRTLPITYRFDGEQPEVEIVQPDGFLLVRRDHPVFGTLTYLREGTIFIELDYDPVTGNLVGLGDSSGNTVNLHYSAEGKIVGMNSNQRELTVEYAPVGKPSKITVSDIGVVHVHYDDYGDITSVESEGGDQVALEIVAAFQDLVQLAGAVGNYHSSGKMPGLPHHDKELAALEQEWVKGISEQGASGEKTRNALKTYVAYLIDHVADVSENYDKAVFLLEDTLEVTGGERSEPAPDLKQVKTVAWAAAEWERLHRKVKTRGFGKHELAYRQHLRRWLHWAGEQSEENRQAVGDVLVQFREEPPVRPEYGDWLEQSKFANFAFWDFEPYRVMFGSEAGRTRIRTALAAKDGALLLGTDGGLMMRSGERWKPVQVLEPGNSGKAVRSVSALAEDADGAIWIGSGNGLFVVEPAGRNSDRWLADEAVLQGKAVTRIAVRDDVVGVGTSTGAFIGNRKGFKPVPALSGAPITLVRPGPSSGARLLVGTAKGLWQVGDSGSVQQLYRGRLTDALMLDGDLYLLDSLSLSRLPLGGNKPTPEPVIRWDRKTRGKSQGLLQLSIRNEEMLGVLTERGLNLVRYDRMQPAVLPGNDGDGAGLSLGLSTPSGEALFVAATGIHFYRPGKAWHDDSAPVLSMVTDRKRGRTYLARGERIDVIDHQSMRPRVFEMTPATHLALGPEGDLYAGGGNWVTRYDAETSHPDVFRTDAVDKRGWAGPIRAVLVSSDGTLWVAAGSSVYRKPAGTNEPEVFNYLLDSERFPSRSPMISGIYETPEGKIRVVASDESHRDHKGVPLKGGVLEWDGAAFKRIARDEGWFVTGYTPYGEGTAIVGTNDGFFVDQNGVRNSLAEQPEYGELKREHPMLWLGRKGVKLNSGDADTWVFPTAGGLVVYQDGKWRYSEQLNRMLPHDQAHRFNGARTVHAVESDGNGTLFAGTDLGLMIYRPEERPR